MFSLPEDEFCKKRNLSERKRAFNSSLALDGMEFVLVGVCVTHMHFERVIKLLTPLPA